MARSSHSAKHMLYFIGVPSVVLSVMPSLAPPTFCMISLTARPMQALARRPELRACDAITPHRKTASLYAALCLYCHTYG